MSPGPLGSAHPLSTPYQAFETKDGWITLGASNQKTWGQFLEVLDAPDIANDPRFADNAGRMANKPELIAALTSHFQRRSTAEWLALLEKAGVPAGPVLSVQEMHAHPQTTARDMVPVVEHATAGKVQTLGLPIKFSGTPGAIKARRAGLRTARPGDSRAGRIHTLRDRRSRRRKCGSRAFHAIRSAERMTERVVVDGLSVAKVLHDFISKEALPGTGVSEAAFWTRLDRIVHDLAPKNRALLKKRDDLQAKIDAWHRARKGKPFDLPAYKTFLTEIGYLVPEGPDFAVDTANVDDEIARIAGPQLVVPVTNARYALNAANARWGSLYDALYGTDALPEDGGATRGGSYNPVRGSKVFAWTKRFLDEIAPLAKGSHTQVKGYAVHDGRLVVSFDSIEETWLDNAALIARAKLVGLADPAQFVGYRGNPSEPRGILLAPQRPARRDPDRQPPLHRQGRHRRRGRRRARVGHHHHRRSGRLRSPPSIPTTRSRPIATGWA